MVDLNWDKITKAAAILNAAPVPTEDRILVFPDEDVYRCFCESENIPYVSPEKLAES